jgi:N utilization substance protein B
MGSRTKARECALQALYQLDTSGGEPRDVLRAIFAHFEDADTETAQFAEQLVRGVQSERGRIDELIQQSSAHWKLDRMARVDRNILRLAVYEIIRRADVPMRVTLNEAVELGKKFGSEESSAFVNGVLDKIAHTEISFATPKMKPDSP